MKKTFVSIAAGAALFAATAVPAFAAGAGYGTQPGYPVANGNTPCANHGAFGAFSGTPGIIARWVAVDHAAGISLGSETGPANSGLCGNPQN